MWTRLATAPARWGRVIGGATAGSAMVALPTRVMRPRMWVVVSAGVALAAGAGARRRVHATTPPSPESPQPPSPVGQPGAGGVHDAGGLIAGVGPVDMATPPYQHWEIQVGRVHGGVLRLPTVWALGSHRTPNCSLHLLSNSPPPPRPQPPTTWSCPPHARSLRWSAFW
jgi:hypothetical protein